jgi:hypothetical protein
VRIGFKADAAAVPDPERLVDLVQDEIESLREAVAVL